MNRRPKPERKCQKCKLIFVHDAVFPSSGCFFKSSILDRTTSVSSVRAKLIPGNQNNSSNFIKHPLLKFSKTITFKIFGTDGFCIYVRLHKQRFVLGIICFKVSKSMNKIAEKKNTDVSVQPTGKWIERIS